jgi:hypothetical protein
MHRTLMSRYDERRRRTCLIVLSTICALVFTACGGSSSEAKSGATLNSTSSSSSTAPGVRAWNVVAFGDSWPEGAHCGGCRSFAELWADDLESLTSRQTNFTDFTGSLEPGVGESETSSSLLASLRTNETTRAATKTADIILVATGPNEIDQAYLPIKARTCGGADQLECIRGLGRLWSENFDAILTEIENLRSGKPTAIRLVDAANPFVSDAEINEGMPDDFATTEGAMIFDQLKRAMCAAATNHGAVCVDVRPILNGQTMDSPVDENSAASMRAVADALLATKLPELA